MRTVLSYLVETSVETMRGSINFLSRNLLEEYLRPSENLQIQYFFFVCKNVYVKFFEISNILRTDVQHGKER